MSDGIIHTPHSAGCYLAEQGRSEYIVPAKPMMETRDKNGVAYKDGRGSSWLRFACNNPDCSSVAAVRWNVLMAFLAATPRPGSEPPQTDSGGGSP